MRNENDEEKTYEIRWENENVEKNIWVALV